MQIFIWFTDHSQYQVIVSHSPNWLPSIDLTEPSGRHAPEEAVVEVTLVGDFPKESSLFLATGIPRIKNSPNHLKTRLNMYWVLDQASMCQAHCDFMDGAEDELAGDTPGSPAALSFLRLASSKHWARSSSIFGWSPPKPKDGLIHSAKWATGTRPWLQ